MQLTTAIFHSCKVSYFLQESLYILQSIIPEFLKSHPQYTFLSFLPVSLPLSSPFLPELPLNFPLTVNSCLCLCCFHCNYPPNCIPNFMASFESDPMQLSLTSLSSLVLPVWETDDGFQWCASFTIFCACTFGFSCLEHSSHTQFHGWSFSRGLSRTCCLCCFLKPWSCLTCPLPLPSTRI